MGAIRNSVEPEFYDDGLNVSIFIPGTSHKHKAFLDDIGKVAYFPYAVNHLNEAFFYQRTYDDYEASVPVDIKNERKADIDRL